MRKVNNFTNISQLCVTINLKKVALSNLRLGVGSSMETEMVKCLICKISQYTGLHPTNNLRSLFKQLQKKDLINANIIKEIDNSLQKETTT